MVTNTEITSKNNVINKEIKNISVKSLYNPETFRNNGYKIVDILSNYLYKNKTKKRKRILTDISPESMVQKWTADFNENPSADLETLIENIIDDSSSLQHPNNMGHQASGPLPLAALCDMVSSIINNTCAAYEMGPVATAIEKNVINWMAKQIGFDDNADGYFTSGGTLGNLTCLLAARQAKAGYNIWQEGIKNDKNITFMISEQAHYSSKRAIQLMGFGEDNIIMVPASENFSMNTTLLEKKYQEAVNQGKKVIAVVGNACSTATGSYDNLEKIANFCNKYDLWFHVDGAHGASAAISDKYKHLLKGAERADSIIWDAHKMMLMPALATAVIFKNGDCSYEVFSQKADYIFDKSPKEEWYNLCHRTMECTKNFMVLKLYTCLKVYGTRVFSDYLNSTYDLTKLFAQMLNDAPDFEIATWPDCNIICYRFTGKSDIDLDKLQKETRKKILDDGSFYITKTKLNGKEYLRCSIMNPHTTEKDLIELIQKIRLIA